MPQRAPDALSALDLESPVNISTSPFVSADASLRSSFASRALRGAAVVALVSGAVACGQAGPVEVPSLGDAPEGADVVAANESAATTSRTSVHGMVMFGHDSVYLSHIPMFTR
ncbi:MAG: hypothetical protein U0169_25745, partial [Polyangiaceae bacterium]